MIDLLKEGERMKNKLMELRKKAGYKNRNDFADALGINQNTYKSWETGRTKLKLEDACIIADFLNCTLDELAGREVPPPKVFTDKRQERMNHCYSMLNDESKEQLAGLASTFTADASRLAFKSGEDTEVGVAERSA